MNALVTTDGSAVASYRRVLIVEDEATLRRVMARNLTGRGLGDVYKRQGLDDTKRLRNHLW